MSLPISPPVRKAPPAPATAEPAAEPAQETLAAVQVLPDPVEVPPASPAAVEPDPAPALADAPAEPDNPAPHAEPAGSGMPDLAELLAAPKRDLWEGAVAIDPPPVAEPTPAVDEPQPPAEVPVDDIQEPTPAPVDLYADARALPEPGGEDPYGIVETRHPSPDGLAPVAPAVVTYADPAEQSPEPAIPDLDSVAASTQASTGPLPDPATESGLPTEEPSAAAEPAVTAEPDPLPIAESPVVALPAASEAAPSDPKVEVVLPSPQQINAMTVPQISGLATDLDGVDNRVTNTRATVTLERMRRLVIADVPEAAGVRLRGAEIDGEYEWELVEVLGSDGNPLTLDKALVVEIDDIVYPLLRELTFSAPPLTALDRRTIRFPEKKKSSARR